ncbi:hypothetical protein KCV07_g9854, partial [Aureobasidium melanogenum]
MDPPPSPPPLPPPPPPPPAPPVQQDAALPTQAERLLEFQQMILRRIAGRRRPAPRDGPPDEDPDDGPVSDDRMVIVGEIMTREGIEPYYLRVDPTMVPHNVMVTITNDRADQLFVFARVPSWRTSSHILADFVGRQGDSRYGLVDLQLSPGSIDVVAQRSVAGGMPTP